MIINDLPFIMLSCLFFTIVIEIIFATIALKIKDKKDLLNILLVNVMTNPIVVSLPVFVNIRYGIIQRNITVIILEIFTVFIEGKIYSVYLKFKKVNPYILSLILNLCSYIIGDIIKYIKF